ncbi:MAG: hypothetical protein WD645_07105 [Dehalococcoidia bacterium]
MGGLGLLLATAGMWLSAERAAAQGGSPPPLPVLFSGEVHLDGELLDGPGSLTARAGDWESAPVPVENGSFTCPNSCLIVGPPDTSYVGEQVTFHLTGPELDGEYEADYTFEFPNASSPDIQQVELQFGGGGGLLDSPLFWGALGGLIALAAVGGSWLMRRQRVKE